MKSKELIRDYPSGDQLKLEFVGMIYANFHYVLCWRLAFFAKIDQGEPVEVSPEYFPIHSYEVAELAFTNRSASEYPGQSQGGGMSLSAIAYQSLQYLENDLLSISEVAPFPPNSNPYIFDRVRQGLGVTSRLELMFSDVDPETQIPSQVVLVNQNTGRRFMVNLQNFNQTLEERIEAVEQAATEPINDKIETLDDLRQRLNKMTSEELSRPAVAVFSDRVTFTRISGVELTNLDHPLIEDQQVLVLAKEK